jgi:hypothetical protein
LPQAHKSPIFEIQNTQPKTLKNIPFLLLFFLFGCFNVFAQEQFPVEKKLFKINQDTTATFLVGVQFWNTIPFYPRISYQFEDKTGLYQMSGELNFQEKQRTQGFGGFAVLLGPWDFRCIFWGQGSRTSSGLMIRGINFEGRRRYPINKSQRLWLSPGLRIGGTGLDYKLDEVQKESHMSVMVLEDGRFPSSQVEAISGRYIFNLEGSLYYLSPVIGINYYIPKTILMLSVDVSYDLIQFSPKRETRLSVTYIDDASDGSSANGSYWGEPSKAVLTEEIADITYQDRPISRFPIQMSHFILQVSLQVRLN